MCYNCLSLLLIILLKVRTGQGLLWEKVQCSTDSDQSTPEGIIPNIGRFPWLGIVQHSFYIGGKVRFAITGSVLIHPAYAIAPAEDIARILPEGLTNNTKIIVWQEDSIKFSLDVIDYILHPEYGVVTMATIALLQMANGYSGQTSPVLPACLPVRGTGTFSDLYAVKFTDETEDLQKAMYKLNYVESEECDEFYVKAELMYDKMTPRSSICAVSSHLVNPCVWDGGSALIAKQSWAHWTLIGFGLRGPGCGAPTRFINIHDYISWVDEVITDVSLEEPEQMHRFLIRRLSPVHIQMYTAGVKLPTDQGQCERDERGNVMYKEAAEVVVNKNFAQGFVYMVVSDIAHFYCANLYLEAGSRSNLAVWVEHHCSKDTEEKKLRDTRRTECFVYYKSSAYVEFRFYFSFKAVVEITLYGEEQLFKRLPDPFHTAETTEPWWPTGLIQWKNFVPVNAWWYWM